MESRRVAYNFPVKPVTDGSLFYLTDASNQMIRVFSNSGDISKIIADGARPVPENIKHIKVNVGIPGWVAVDDNGNVYIQKRSPDSDEKNKNPVTENEIPEHPENAGPARLSTREFVPSTIVILDDSDILLGEMGEDGLNTEKFQTIYRMDAGDDNTLFVNHLYKGEKTLSIYKNGNLSHRIKSFNPADEKELNKYYTDIEDIVPHPEKKFAIASVIFRNKKNFDFQYRKVYHIDYETGNYEEIAWLDEPDDHFGWIREDGGFYLLHADEDGSRIKFRIYSNTGEHINNLQITLTGLRASWRETYLTLDGKFYSSRIYKNRFEFYEWQ